MLKKYDKYVDIAISFIAIIFSILIIVLSIFFELRQEYFGIMILLSTIAYIFLLRKRINAIFAFFSHELNLSNVMSYSLIIIFLICLAISASIIRETIYGRSLYYFLIISILAAIIAIQALFSKVIFKYIILLEILIVSFNIRYSVFYEFPSVYGKDPFYHLSFIQSLISLSYVPSYGEYTNFPIMHLLVAVLQIITEMSGKDAFFIVGVIEVLSTVFLYILVNYFTGVKLALFSTLIFNLSDYIIKWGFWVIPMTLSLTYFIIILFILLVKYKFEAKQSSFRICLLLLLICLMLNHSLSSFILLVVIFSFLLPSPINFNFKHQLKDNYVYFNIFCIFLILNLAYWISVFPPSSNISFFSMLIHNIVNAVNIVDAGNVEMVTLATKLPIITIILNYFGYYLLVSFTIIGLLISIYLNNCKLFENANIYSSIFLLFSCIYLTSFMGTNVLLPGRWFAFLYILTSFYAPLGIIALIQINKNIYLRLVLTFVIVSALAFFMITNSISNPDSPIYSYQIGERNGFYESELQGALKISNFYDGNISSDYLAGFLKPVSPLYLDKNPNNGMIVIRRYALDRGISVHYSDAFSKIVKLNNTWLLNLRSKNYNVMYNNNEITGYIQT